MRPKYWVISYESSKMRHYENKNWIKSPLTDDTNTRKTFVLDRPKTSNYVVELRVVGLDRLECDVRITLIGQSDSIIQMASIAEKAGYVKLSEQTRIQLTAPVGFGSVNTIKVELIEPKPTESLFVENIRLTVDNDSIESWFYFSAWLGAYLENGKLELISKATSSRAELKCKTYEIVVTTANDAYVMVF